MKTVIFHTENAAFKFDQKEVKARLICKHSEYAPGEVTQLLALISTDTSEILLIPDDHNYFGHVAADLIGGQKSEIGILPSKYRFMYFSRHVDVYLFTKTHSFFTTQFRISTAQYRVLLTSLLK